MNTEFEYKYFLELIRSGNIEAAFDYRSKYTPDYLYKFYWLTDDPNDDNNKKRFYSLKNNYIWFANPGQQNDPYEFHGVYWDENKLLSLGVHQDSIRHAKKMLFKQIALSAFTSNMNDNLPMWAHYTNNHHGYCVKYKVGNRRTFRNVIYGEQRVSVTNTFAHFINNGLKGMQCNDMDFFKQAEMDSAILQDKFFYKHISWSYENEYRALYPFDGETKGLNVSIDELGLIVEGIYSGINCSDGNRLELSQIASVLNVPYKECKINNIDFTVF